LYSRSNSNIVVGVTAILVPVGIVVVEQPSPLQSHASFVVVVEAAIRCVGERESD
jgi:hypothetical protein